MPEQIASFAEFWPHYLRAHGDPRTRAAHYLGTSLGILLFLAFIATGDWLLLPCVLLAGYGFAWLAHAGFEHNRPATFDHPLWSFVGDFYMLYCWATRRLGAELERAQPAPSLRRARAAAGR
jgi:hypothetical protein